MQTKYSLVCRYCGKRFDNQHPDQKYCSRHCWAQGSRKTTESFWLHVDRSGGPDACWFWLSSKDEHGYGEMKYHRKSVQPHRFAWELIHGPIPEGLEVCHNCPGGDTPSCVNPSHMFLGTHKQNMQDAKRKGRTTQGERDTSAKLTADQVTEIRRRYAKGGIRQIDLARKYGVTRANVSAILIGRSWQHLLEP